MGLLSLAVGGQVPAGPWGEDLFSDIFAVRKSETEDRAILKRVRRNAVEESVDAVTSSMPHGNQFEDVELAVGEGLRFSADDLPNYYHLGGVNRERQLTNAFGPRLSRADIEKWCPRAFAMMSDEDKDNEDFCSLWACLPMGDLNAVSFAQIAHANLLRKFGGLREEHLLVYRRPIPMSSVQEGVMIDDHVVTAIVPLSSRAEDWDSSQS